MSNDTATSADDARPNGLTGLGSTIDAFIVTITIASLALCSIVALMEVNAGHGEINWTLFALISALLVATETTSTTWLRFGDGGVVTPSWTFTFSLILLGSPTGAIAVMAATTVFAEVHAGKPTFKVVFNTAQITLSLAIGSLILFAFGIHGPLFVDNSLSTRSAIAMLISGIVVFLSNGVIICRLLATVENTGFWQMMRESFALSMSADAAMLAMAPILLVSALNSLLMLPLIGTATFFVYQTARHAILRAYEANHDPLTQLMNRRAFTAGLDDFTQSGLAREGAVFILDLDKFKDINDRLGHATGDHVLQQFSARLRQSLGDEITIARLGGDEFAVLLEDTSPDEAIAIARELHADLDAPLKVDGFPISAGSSIGVALSPHDGTTPSELLHAADVAMYRAKRFRSGVEVYESYGASKPRGRLTLLADIVGAIENDEFFLEYQPQVELATGHVGGVEALLRWNHPVHGLIPPAEFIVLAEHTDLIVPITDFVVERAIREVAAVHDELRVSINVSARNLQDRHFAERLLETIATAGVDPDRIEIEITESAATIEQDRTDVTIEQLRSAGVQVAIDDFGTGYSSFATLRDLSADRIKIDRSFITNMMRREADATIVRSVIDVAHGLGLDVVAEGVETAEVHALLGEWGCDVAQGFHFSRPLPASALPTIAHASARMHDRPCRADIGLVDDRAAVVVT